MMPKFLSRIVETCSTLKLNEDPKNTCVVVCLLLRDTF